MAVSFSHHPHPRILDRTRSAPPKGADDGRLGINGRIGLAITTAVGTMWCAYAHPQTFKTTGTRAFFTSQAGDVLQCDNTVAKHQGMTTPIRPDSAFLGAGITSALAVGTKGNDGEVWKITN